MGNPIQNYRHTIKREVEQAYQQAPSAVASLYEGVMPLMQGTPGLSKEQQVQRLTTVRDMLVAFDTDDVDFSEYAEIRKAEWQAQRDSLQSKVDYLMQQIVALDAALAEEDPVAGLRKKVTLSVESATDAALKAVTLAQERDLEAYLAEKHGGTPEEYEDEEYVEDDDL